MKDQIFNAFNQIHAEEALIEKTLEGMYSYRAKKERRAFFARRGMALAVSFALMLCIGGTGWNSYFTQAFALTVDVNPSVEMSVNRFDKVISVKGFNEEAEDVLSGIDVKHMNYADAVDCLLEEEKACGYLEEEGNVLVAVVCPKEKKAIQVKETLDAAQADTPQTVDVIQPKKAAVDEAPKHDMSVGKYQAYLDLQEVKPEVTVEEVKEMSVAEITTIIKGETDAPVTADKTPSSESSESAGSTETNADTSATTNASPNKGTNGTTSATPNKDTNANTSATPNKGNSGTSANTGATPNKGNSGTSANTGATPNSTDKKPAVNTNTDNASDKKPAGNANSNNTVTDKVPGEQPAGSTNTDTAPSEEPVQDTVTSDNAGAVNSTDTVNSSNGAVEGDKTEDLEP